MTIPAGDSPAAHLPDTLRLGPVHVTVSTVDGSVAFYERALGLQLHDRDGNVATMGTGGEDLVILVEEPGAAPGGRHAGLYHFALRFEERRELARAVKRLASTQTRIENASDHGVLEAIYLRDPDDNGIELYADRPSGRWPAPRLPGDRVEMPTFGRGRRAPAACASGRCCWRRARRWPRCAPASPPRAWRRALTAPGSSRTTRGRRRSRSGSADAGGGT